jgi:hypothetical protein
MTGSDRRADTLHNREIHICTLHDIYHDRMCGKYSIHERHTDISTKFLFGDLKTREHLSGIYVSGKVILK